MEWPQIHWDARAIVPDCILRGDRASEALLSEIVGAQPWPGQRHKPPSKIQRRDCTMRSCALRGSSHLEWCWHRDRQCARADRPYHARSSR